MGIVTDAVQQAFYCGETDDVIDWKAAWEMAERSEPHWPSDAWLMFIYTSDGADDGDYIEAFDRNSFADEDAYSRIRDIDKGIVRFDSAGRVCFASVAERQYYLATIGMGELAP